MLTMNVKRHTKYGDVERIVPVEEVFTEWEFIEPALVNPPVPSLVVIGVDAKGTHHSFDEGYIYVMNAHGKTVATYILGERVTEAGRA